MLCASLSGSSLVVAPAGTVCGASDLVVFTSAEAGQLFNSPFNLSIEQGGAVAVAVLSVWAVAWAFRVVIKALNPTEDISFSDDK